MTEAQITIEWSSVQRKSKVPSREAWFFDADHSRMKAMSYENLVITMARACNQVIAKQFSSKPFKHIKITFNGRFKNRGGHCEWIEEGSDFAHVMIASSNSCPAANSQEGFLEVLAHELIHAKQMQKGELKWRGGDFEWMGDRVRKDLGLKYRQFGHEVEAFDNQVEVSRQTVAYIFSPPADVFACPHCGKEYQSRQGRYRHIKSGICQH